MPNITLDMITEKAQALFKNISKKSQSVVGIDIGSSAIKVVQLKKEAGKIVLQTYGEIAMGPYAEKKAGEIPTLSTEVLATAIKDLLRESNVTTTDVAMSIQASASLLFVLELPHVSEREISTIVPNEARKYIPVPLTEVSLDYWLIPRQEYTDTPGEDVKKQPLEVLVAAIRNETIQEYRDIATQAGLRSGLFEIEVFSTIRSTFHHELSSVALIDFGASSTRVSIIEYGVVKSFHTINRGSHYISQSLEKSLTVPFDEAEKIKKEIGLTGEGNDSAREVINTAVSYIFSELNSVLFNYEKENHKSVGKVILTGGGSRLKGFFEQAEKELVGDIVFGDPFQKAESPQFLDGILAESGPEFAVAVGLALKKLQ